jgi:hypothetical protein
MASIRPAAAVPPLHQRIDAVDRWARALVDDADRVCGRWSELYGIASHDLLHYELAALCAALDELADCAERELHPERTRRWLGAEPVRSRFEAPHSRLVRVPGDPLPAAPLALVAAAFVAGSAVTLSASEPLREACELALDCAKRNGLALSLDLVDEPQPGSSDSMTSALLGPARPAIAWLDAVELVKGRDALCERLERAARYGGGLRRGALRWIAGRPAVIDALFEAGAPWKSAAEQRAMIRGVWIERAALGEGHLEVASPTLIVEPFDNERAWIERARQFERFSACSAFGVEPERLRSLAARTEPDAIFIDSTPACAMGGLSRAEFDARRWLRAACREVPVVYGAPSRVAAVTDSSAGRKWLRAWLRLALGRYGLGGRIDDLW